MTSRFRCCQPLWEIPTTYASVLVTGHDKLQERIQKLEQSGIIPCLTGWCKRHHRVSLLIPEGADTEYLVHTIRVTQEV